MTLYSLQTNPRSNHHIMLHFKSLLLIVIVALSGVVHAQSDSDCRAANQQALIDLYYATDGWNWNQPWNLDQPMEEWYGVQMQGGCVTGLYLGSNNLFGTIPASINTLSELRALDLAANNLYGNIPSTIGDLTNLQVLHLHQNQLQGEIPEAIGQLWYLQSLNLQMNRLSGRIPSTFGNLTELHTLALNDNQLTGSFPETLGTLYNLVFLDLGNNQLQGALPSSIGGLSSLANLELNNNNFDGCLPSSISQLHQLETLLLSNNSFICAFPQEIFSLSNLTWLYLDNNLFYGWLPDSFNSLSRLTVIHLNNNILSGPLPNSLGDLTSLEEVYFQINYFSGCFPNNYNTFCGRGASFVGNTNLPNNGDFERFCSLGEGRCDEDPVCLSFRIEGLSSSGCTPNRNLTVFIDGGTAPYTITLSGPLNGSGQTNNNVFSITSLPYGVYGIKITDINGCESMQDFDVNENCVSFDDATATSRSKASELNLEITNPVLKVQPSFPNPFTNGTTIPVVLSEKKDLNIRIFTVNGQLIYQDKQSFDIGTNLIKLDQNVFKESGMYIYQIEQGARIESGKLIKQQ